MVLSGDRNLAVAGVPVPHGLLEVTPKISVTWFKPRHNNGGNFALADGSVQEVNSATLRKLLWSGGATNRLAMP